MNEEGNFLSFNIKFRYTEENLKLFKQFKQFAKENTQDGYFMAIMLLLERNEMLELLKKDKNE